jgi:hypothetical protein
MAPSLRSLLVAIALAAALPASASAALTKVADPVNVAPDDQVALQQYYPDVAMAADGGFAVSYSEIDDPNEQVYVQRFTAGFAKLGARIPVGLTTQRNTQPAIAMAPDGRFAVAFQTYNNFPATPSSLIEVQRFAADGTPAGALLAPDDAERDNDANPPAIAMAADGRFSVAWVSFSSGLRLRSYAASGTPLTAATEIDPTASSNAHPSIGMAGDGRFALAAVRPSSYDPVSMTFSNELVPLRRFHADGTPDGPEIPAYTGPAGSNYADTAVGMGNDGRPFLAWADRHGPTPGEYEADIWARRFDAAGAPLGDRFIANDYTTYAQTGPDVEVDAHGDAFVAYEGQNGTQRWGYLRHFAADGTPDGIGEHISTAPSDAPQRIHVDSDGQARTAMAYQSSSQGTNNEVYVARWNYAAVSDPPATPASGGGGTPAPGAPAAPAAPVVPPAAPPAPSKPVKGASVVKVADVVTFPAATSCASRRKFGIRLRVPKNAGVTQATVKVNGRTVAVRKGTRLRSTVDLRSLPKGKFTVSIALKLANGKTVKGERRYRTCIAKGKGGKPKV